MNSDTDACHSCAAADRCVARALGFAGNRGTEISRKIVRFQPGDLIERRGAQTESLTIIRSGWAFRFSLFADGRRQIVEILLDGDFASCDELARPEVSTSLSALTELETCAFDREAFREALRAQVDNIFLLAQECTSHSQRLRELVATIGRQSAESRLVSFLLGLRDRLAANLKTVPSEVPFPFRQQDLADLLGLTQVHVSRTLKSLKSRNLIDIVGDRLAFLNPPVLERIRQS